MDNTYHMPLAQALSQAEVVQPSVFLVTQSSLQSENFRRMLQDKTQMLIEILPTSTSLSDFSFPSNSIVIIDIASTGLDHSCCEVLRNSESVAGTVLLNHEGEMDVNEVLRWRSLRGSFSAQDSLDHVCNGLCAISKGENWLPRKLVDMLINHYENSITQVEKDDCLAAELTRRELEILESLKSGGSNIEIADSLFVSEHTIKSHLYNIFKKLEVKNRTQAMSWAKKNL
ncbi:LuxR C-terminal-related transcriptional regulator [Vibrio agarivorans]|uniref:LuxR C-terminal-related transcriptional regulator n=1 Tax=Vibrio agarivorans TaxID=153622 RepID=UPI00222E64E9|nr:LuxR C-terminal-related transcriptional regulator [Vibrio agarivorans]